MRLLSVLLLVAAVTGSPILDRHADGADARSLSNVKGGSGRLNNPRDGGYSKRGGGYETNGGGGYDGGYGGGDGGGWGGGYGGGWGGGYGGGEGDTDRCHSDDGHWVCDGHTDTDHCHSEEGHWVCDGHTDTDHCRSENGHWVCDGGDDYGGSGNHWKKASFPDNRS